jgi:cell division protease FtsH
MAEEPNRRPSTPRLRPDGSNRPGWRVTPTPDGRGKPPGTPTSRGPNPRWVVALLVLVLLGLNLWISTQALQPNSRVRIPYSPTFLTQVRSGNVSEISSTNNAIQGTFKTDVKYPSNDKNAVATTRFSTQVPSFANNQQLTSLLESENVTIDAKSPDTGPSFLTSLIFGFGPTLLLIALFVLIGRRAAAAAGGGGGLMSFGRSRARRIEGGDQRVTFNDVAGIDEAKEELTEIVDFLKNPDK